MLYGSDTIIAPKYVFCGIEADPLFLKTGVIFASFHDEGNTALLSDLLKSIVRG